jgi:hypothetical protein
VFQAENFISISSYFSHPKNPSKSEAEL